MCKRRAGIERFESDSRADAVARALNYENAEKLKESFGLSKSHDMAYDKATKEILLLNKDNTYEPFHTGLKKPDEVNIRLQSGYMSSFDSRDRKALRRDKWS